MSKAKAVNKKNNDNKKKENIIFKMKMFVRGVKSEFVKVHWTKKKDLIKYSIATIFFLVFSATFFYLIDILFAVIQSLF